MERADGQDADEAARAWLFAFVRDRDVACPLCGYNLRGLVSPRCPECGREVRLRVGLAEPYVRAWVAATVACGLGAGMGVFVAVVIGIEGWPPPRMFMLGCSLVVFLAFIPVMAAVVMFRRRFMKLARPTQVTLAAVAVVLLVAGLLMFFGGVIG